MGMFRTAVLEIDRSTVLPLLYEYDTASKCFRSVGYVRIGSRMVPSVSHSAPDTTTGRDAFLVKVLQTLLVPDRQARKIVQKAQHAPK